MNEFERLEAIVARLHSACEEKGPGPYAAMFAPTLAMLDESLASMRAQMRVLAEAAEVAIHAVEKLAPLRPRPPRVTN